MIQPILVIFLILPIILGILSVDINGDRISIRDWIKDNIMTEPIRDAVKGYLGEVQKVENQTQPQLILGVEDENKKIEELTSKIADGITFLFLQSREFGIWLGMNTAPFHYFLAILIGFVFLYPLTWMFIIGFFYIMISERKEIFNEMRNARKRVKMQ